MQEHQRKNEPMGKAPQNTLFQEQLGYSGSTSTNLNMRKCMQKGKNIAPTYLPENVITIFSKTLPAQEAQEILSLPDGQAFQKEQALSEMDL